MNGEDYIGAEEAGRILHVSSRMVYRYAEGDSPKLRTMRAGRRVLFNRADVLAYADEQGAENRPAPATDIVRADELMLLVREQQAKLEAAARRIGELEAQLGARLLPDDEAALRQRIHELERQQDRLHWENEQLQARLIVQRPEEPGEPQRPWWRRLLGS